MSESIKRSRIRVALFAFAYEVKNDSLIPDSEYDVLSGKVDDQLFEATDNSELDFWFSENFDCFTGMWVRSHPEIDKLARLYERIKKNEVFIEDF
jgi:hypothetical protein